MARTKIKEPVPLSKIDLILIKAKDLPVLFAIERFLRTHGLEAKVAGFTIKNTQKGLPRAYSDIDLLVQYKDTPCNQRYRVIMCLSRKEEGQFPKGTNIENISSDESSYLDTVVENRFAITNGTTQVDLCFQGKIGRQEYMAIFNLPKLSETMLSKYMLN